MVTVKAGGAKKEAGPLDSDGEKKESFKRADINL